METAEWKQQTRSTRTYADHRSFLTWMNQLYQKQFQLMHVILDKICIIDLTQEWMGSGGQFQSLTE